MKLWIQVLIGGILTGIAVYMMFAGATEVYTIKGGATYYGFLMVMLIVGGIIGGRAVLLLMDRFR